MYSNGDGKRLSLRLECFESVDMSEVRSDGEGWARVSEGTGGEKKGMDRVKEGFMLVGERMRG